MNLENYARALCARSIIQILRIKLKEDLILHSYNLIVEAGKERSKIIIIKLP